MTLRVQIGWRLRKRWRAVTLLRRVAIHTALAEGFSTGVLSVTVVGSRAMTTLHRRYLGGNEPTDVLAFDLGCNRRKGLLDAEIVLCADLARTRGAACASRPATRNRQSAIARAVRAELALYLVHGLLHMAGYDDDTPTAARRMHAREDELLSELGLGPVFHAGM
jgi:probable rRNA maturation factor